MGQTWTEYFFQDCPPSLVKLFRESPQDPESFKRFECNGSWRLGKPLRTDMPPGHTIMVLPLTVREGNSKDPRYVAKTVSQTTPKENPKWHAYPFKFSDFTIEQAETHIRTSGLSLRRSSNYSPQEVQSQLDPFLVEARVFEHIQHHCPESQKIFFPRYLGVLADIPRRKYPMSCLLRRRAVVMERIYPDLASRRILAAAASPTSPAEIHWINVDHDHDPMQRLHQELHNIPCISPFEITWYESLLSDRLRRTTCLHDIGIIHGDIRDDHFRIPGDFYDTVLYDFSASYVFSPSIPCRWRLRRLWDLRRDEREMLWQIVLER